MKRRVIEILRARREVEEPEEQREPRRVQTPSVTLPTWPERGAIDELFREAARWR
jgi:hypothetical protein